MELPKAVYIHGFISVEGEKISKSLGNVVDPIELVEKYGKDAVRYFLLREISTFEDSPFTIERFKEAYNANLANGLGNLVSRVVKLSTEINFNIMTPEIHPKFFDLVIDTTNTESENVAEKIVQRFKEEG